MGVMAGEGCVECVGLIGDLSSGATRAKQGAVAHFSDCSRHVNGVVLSPVSKWGLPGSNRDRPSNWPVYLLHPQAVSSEQRTGEYVSVNRR